MELYVTKKNDAYGGFMCFFLHLLKKKKPQETEGIEGNLCNCFQNSTAFAVPCFAEII